MTDEDEPVDRSGGGARPGDPWTPEAWRRIDAILQEAIPLPASDRPALLSRACADADERRLVERLLELHDRRTDFLEDGVGSIAAEAFRPTGQALSAGDRLGPYDIVRPLGRGGMGVVYLGRDPRLDRLVAIKLLSPELEHDARQRARLRHEARSAASVSHPGIAHVYAFEEHERDAYIVSEYVDGHTLRDEITNGPLAPAQARHTAVQIARAVGAAHDRRIVHRDLKPENVMRTAAGDVKVLDFGLALSLSALTRLTVTGTLLGTLGYMSPEQLRGEEASPASDVFALGLVLYELLSGGHAFAGSHPASHVTRVLDHEPNPLPPQVRDALPGLDAVVRRCLEKRPERRYSSMEELAIALERLDAAPSAAAHRRSGSGPIPSGEVGATSGGLWWWQMHQTVVSAFYGLTLVPIWFVRPTFTSVGRGDLHAGLFVVAVAAMAAAAGVRLNLAFTARVHPWLLGPTRARTRLLVHVSDWVMALSLLVASGVALVAERPELAALLGGLAVFVIVSFLVIEPGTARAVFPEDETPEDAGRPGR